MPNATIMCWPSGHLELFKGLSCGPFTHTSKGLVTSLDVKFALETGTRSGQLKAIILSGQAIHAEPARGFGKDMQWFQNYRFALPDVTQISIKGITASLESVDSIDECLYVSVLGMKAVGLTSSTIDWSGKVQAKMRDKLYWILKTEDPWPAKVHHFLLSVEPGGSFYAVGGCDFGDRPQALSFSWDGKRLVAREQETMLLKSKLERKHPDKTHILNFLNGPMTVTDELLF